MNVALIASQLEKKPIKGRYKKGDPSPNPSGKPPSTWQPPAQRAEALTRFYTPKEITRMAKAISAGKDTPLSSQDAIVCVHLANIYKADGLERERLYDRTFGKVPDRQVNVNVNLDVAPEQLSDRALTLLEKIAPVDDQAFDDEASLIDE